jgi:glycosyltransferase involved in cell wall biosynthesis
MNLAETHTTHRVSTAATRRSNEPLSDVLCFSHLRWNFVFQRPQHLMTRLASERRVFFFEEPIFDASMPSLETRRDGDVLVAVPHLPAAQPDSVRHGSLRMLLLQLMAARKIDRPLFWYYTPMALEYSRAISHSGIVFDCMDELSAFSGAPPSLVALERELLSTATIVFTGGQSLYERKRQTHPRVHVFPSSVDVAHFARARAPQPEPADQAAIPHPRLGFCGVVDERMDLSLIEAVARQREQWHQVILGPCVKIDEASLPRLPNIHYLGMKRYDDLPAYLSGWDVALLPFARNESTRFISPTKTPEYLAAGRPVVSTSIADVVRPYGQLALAGIADEPAHFVAAVERALVTDRDEWLPRVDRFLAGLSWDRTWASMRSLIEEATQGSGVAGVSRPGAENALRAGA